jgi:hypothetical protein
MDGLMGMYICPRCDGMFDSKDGECIPARDKDGNHTFEVVNEPCATPEELFAYMPGFYDDPNAPCECGEWKCDECRMRIKHEQDLAEENR